MEEQEQQFKYKRPELSETTLPDPTKRYGDTDFWAAAAFIMLDNEEYEYLQHEKYAVKADTIEQKQIKTADNIYDIRNFFHDHMKEIQTNKTLQDSLKKKLDGLKKLVKGQTETALLLTLQMKLESISETNTEETDE